MPRFTGPAAYVATAFFSAVLLFALQPMFARMTLPLLGGSPSVWNTALVFYQATLLAGYVYAHLSTRLLGVRRQAFIHFAILLAPLAVLPIRIPSDAAPPADTNPTAWMLGLLATAIGLPFFAVSTTAPLLQRWFAATRHSSASDPYFLYAASNAGSFLALMSYPLVVEPLLPLTAQGRWWTFAYAVFVILMTLSAIAVIRTANHAPEMPAMPAPPSPPRVWLTQRGRWLVLALIPSSLMLGATTHISMDLAAVPLLWIVPLSIYLFTFVLVFARRPPPHRLFVRLLPMGALAIAFVFAVKASEPLGLVITLHLVMLFLAAMVCHGELARTRPPAERLTEFYLWMAAGGVLGGLFNALFAPVVFRSVAEYPLMLIAVLLVAPLDMLQKPAAATAPVSSAVPRLGGLLTARVLDVGLPAMLALLTFGLVKVMHTTAFTPRTQALVAFGIPALIAFGFSRRSVRFALAVAAIVVVSTYSAESTGRILHSERTFFGVHRVTIDEAGSFRHLLHGRTMHGLQSTDPARRHQPLGYYSANGPLGEIIASVIRRPARVAVVGLGNGGVAAYALPGERWTFFEIDPAVARIARDARWFTFLTDSRGSVRVVLGDGRLSLAAMAESYDLIILDAYSAETIPVHLLNREALQLYVARLAPRGVIAFHISNTYFDLAPVVAALARDAGLVLRLKLDNKLNLEQVAKGHTASEWAIMARDVADLGPLATDAQWQDRQPPHGRVWTDDHSNVLNALR